MIDKIFTKHLKNSIMNYILFGDQTRNDLLPFTFIRPIADIRVGILTIREKWEQFLKVKTSSLTEEYLSLKYPLVKKNDNILINGSILPNRQIIDEIGKLKSNQTLVVDDTIIALRLKAKDIDNFDLDLIEGVAPMVTSSKPIKITNIWDIFIYNGQAIKDDFELLTKGKNSQEIITSNHIVEPGNVFVEEGAIIENAIINASEGPVYIGKSAHVMDGSMVRGPAALCHDSLVRMGAKIYGNTTIGPYCKVGGEVINSVLFGFSNKAHDGFLGHSVIGEWCNLGANTTTSNLKNNYETIRVWSYTENSFAETGLQFCGTFLGDHSKCGINTMFNTGTVVGISANIFGTGFMRNFIPSFSWGSVSGFSIFEINKAIQLAKRVYERRNKVFDRKEESILRDVYERTFNYRKL